MERYSADEVAKAANVRPPVLAYWQRIELLTPTGAAGSYTAHEIAVAIVLGEAAHIGAPAPILTVIAAALSADAAEWPDVLVVDSAGRTSTDHDDLLAGWSVRPRRVLAAAGPQLMVALALAS